MSGAGGLGSLMLEIGANLARLSSDLGKANHMFEQFAEGANHALEKIGAGLSIAYFAEMITESIKAQDQLYELTKVTGASVDALEQLRQVAQLTGTNFGDVSTAMSRLAKNMSGIGVESKVTTQAIKFLNIDVKDGLGNYKDTAVVLREVAEALSKYSDGAGKQAIVQDLLGKGAAVLLPYLEKLAEAETQHTNVTAESVKMAHEFTVQMREMKEASEQFWIHITNELLPTLIELLDKFLKLKASGGWINVLMGFADLKDGTESINDMNKKLYELQKTRDALAASSSKSWVAKVWNLDDLKIVDAQIATITARVKAMQSEETAKIKSMPQLTEPPGAKDALNYNRGDAAAAAAEIKLYQGALQKLELELGKLSLKSDEQKIKYETESGSLMKLTEAHKANLLVVAKQVDMRRSWLEMMDIELASTKELEATRAASDQTLSGHNKALATSVNDKQFELDLIGKTSSAIEVMTKMRMLDQQERESLSKVDSELNSSEYEGIIKATATYRGEWIKAYAAVYLESRKSSTGMTEAINEYSDAVTNSAAQTKMLFTNAFKSIEDALVNFVTTGKLDFKTLADSIIKDMVRIEIQRGIMGPLVGTASSPGLLSQGLNKLSGGFGGLFSGLFGGGPTLAQGAPLGFDGPGYATGTGFVPSDGLAMLHRGEAVIPAAQNSGGGRTAPNVYMTVVTQDANSFNSSRSQIASRLSAALSHRK